MSSRFARVHPFEMPDLSTPEGFELARRRALACHAKWYTEVHTHTCDCGRVIAHTGLESLRTGDSQSHFCCNGDVRDPLRGGG